LGADRSQSSSQSRFLAFGVRYHSTRTLIDLPIELGFNIYACNADENLKNRLIMISYLSPEVYAQGKNTYIAASSNHLISCHGLFAVPLASEFCALCHFLIAGYILSDAL